MQAYLYYNTTAQGNYICAKYDTPKERITAYYDCYGIFHQHWSEAIDFDYEDLSTDNNQVSESTAYIDDKKIVNATCFLGDHSSREHQQYTITQDIPKNIQDTVPRDAVLSHYNVGDVIQHMWRPGLSVDTYKETLNINEGEKMGAQRALKILMEKLHDILLYIEPSKICMRAYGHKIRELLILACTECENTWMRI